MLLDRYPEQLVQLLLRADEIQQQLRSLGLLVRPGEICRTGNDLKMTSITIHRIANGKLVEKWAEKDVLGFLQQIGVMPSAGHGGA
jgi:hypothetical protein